MKTDKIENFEVIRSFSRKVQLAPFEPIEYFASYKAVLKNGATLEELEEVSNYVAELAENAVQDKLDPSKSLTRRKTIAELTTKLKLQQKQMDAMQESLNKLDVPFN